MSTSVLKKELHEAIDRISDLKALKSFHSIVTLVSGNGNESTLSEEQWEEVERRHSDYISGRVKYLTFDEFTHNINAFKKTLRKKNRARTARNRRV
ncbi:MAG TPA: hypothetical protein VE978_01205 [Chitinophagales bacterium]|nr:hypothetical protein [Chitinophagales bacterium]